MQHLLHKGSPGVQLIIAIRAIYKFHDFHMARRTKMPAGRRLMADALLAQSYAGSVRE
ncbi:MAG: hypothetical protein MR959_05335 [Selenomonas bovis]|nr:hypothetical protein [Selenomonas bovis]